MELLNNFIVHKVIIVTAVILISVIIWKMISHYHYLRGSRLRSQKQLDYLLHRQSTTTNIIEYLSRITGGLLRFQEISTKLSSKVKEFDQALHPSDDELMRDYPEIYKLLFSLPKERNLILTRCDTLINQLEKNQVPDDLDKIVSELTHDIFEVNMKMESLHDLIDSKLKMT